MIAVRFLARGSGSGSQPGSFGASPVSCQARSPKAGSAARRSASPSRRSSAGVRSIPAKWPPRAVGDPARTMVGDIAPSLASGGHHASMRLTDFALERYFARWEFHVEHLLCASDVQGYPMTELLALADAETRAMWDGLTLGYTESTGHPLLRREIAALYDGLEPEDVLVFAG